MVDFKALETFMWVATLRSFRGAAEKLNTTQPAVSMRIAQLEDFLGIRLIERDRRRVSPTQKGLEMLGYAERLMRLRAEMIDAVGNSSTMRGLVRLGVSESIVHTWLPVLIERVNAAYPNLELEIEVDISPNLHEQLLNKELNLGLLLGPISHPALQSRPLCSFPVGFVCSDKIRFGKTRIELEDIAKWPIITFSRNTQPYSNVRELFERKGLRPTIHASASLATIVRMALDGIGVAVIPSAIIDNIAFAGRLRVLKTRPELPKLNFVVSWPATPDNFAAQKVAEIAGKVAREKA
ncbi:MAG TPA: LysR family transcriptional regulator [Pseudolabrys sp.]